jgi:hypothetical protein
MMRPPALHPRTWLGVVLLATLSSVANAQDSFLTIGAGPSFPTGSGSSGMKPGFMAEAMAGRVLPGGYASARIGAMYGQSRIGGGMGMNAIEPGTQRILGAMAGLMAMPKWDYDWFPYVLATAGVVKATFQGSTSSFAWATGAGTTLQWQAVDFYLEGRFLEARNDIGRGQMVSVTTGLRFAR